MRKPLHRLPFSYLFTGLIFVLVFINCKPKPEVSESIVEEVQPVDTLPSDFVEFYDRFHEDSIYQMERIIFPLEGLPNSLGDGDTIYSNRQAQDQGTTKRFFWPRDGWKKHNHFTDPSNQFEHWYQVLDERLIEHWVQMKGTDMVIHRRFAKLDNGWYLIYYAGLRPYEK